MVNSLLQIKNLSVEVEGRRILNKVNLDILRHSTVILFGPNGSGKSTLIKTIMGFGGYQIVEGEIIFEGRDIKGMPPQDRARLGIGVMFQHPPKIRGVKLSQIAKFLTSEEKEIDNLAEKLKLREMLERDLNIDFSGGEMKRSELFQVILQNPKLLMLDEPESGVDLENISLMGSILKNFLQREKTTTLIITHTGYILDYIEAETGCVMIGGSLYCTGNPHEIFENIRRFGYEKCKECKC